MNIPNVIHIAGSDFEVVREKDVGFRGNRGECSLEGLVIRLDPTRPLVRQHRTLVHEIIEALNDELDIGLKHHQVNLLEAGFYEVLVNNPEIFRPNALPGGYVVTT